MERLTDSYVSMMGFHASLKICRAGLMLVTDIALSCFLEGGDFVELMAAACGFRNFEEPLRESQRYFEENERRAQSGRAGSVAPRGKRSRDEAASDRNLGLPDQLMEKMEVAFQSAKLRETYTWKWKKFEGFGESFVPFPKVVM